MADLVTGALGNLVPKLYELLKEEYGIQKGVKKRIRSLTKELEGAHAALGQVAELPWDQVDKQVQLWAMEVREASYDMEDVLDTFLVRVQGPADSTEQQESLLKRFKKVGQNYFHCCNGNGEDSLVRKKKVGQKKSLLKTMEELVDLFKVRHRINNDLDDIMTHLQEVTERCRRYKVHDIVDRPAKSSPIDPRLHALYNKVQDLVGIHESKREFISKLQPLQWDGTSNLKMKIVSIVGVGGLGKTTLAKAVYDEFKGDFNYGAFVPVGRNPDLKKVLKDILMDLDKQRRLQLSAAVLDERQLIDDLRPFLKNKRYFIVIDDIWDIPSWEPLKLAIGDDDNNCGARIVITTRNQEVAKEADEAYNLRPLPDDISRELFFTRIGGDEGKLVNNNPNEVTINKFLKKCDGIPLAIITMASLLAGKPRDKWDELYRSIGFGSEDNKQAQNTMRIVSFSYYDLPAHLRTCLLYLSAFPEDSVIRKDRLVWMWVAEGFVKMKQGMRLFEAGEGYFHDLVNRSMLEAVKAEVDDSIVTGCRVHDMVLDFLRSMSHQENFLSVVLGNVQGTLLESNNVPRRLAHHDRIMGHGRGQGDDLNVEKVRSMFAIGCGIESSDPFHVFRLLRVLVIDNCWGNNNRGRLVFRNEHVRHLVHLRFLGIRRTFVKKIPEEIGRLRFLQTLDLHESYLDECRSLGSLPEQLVRLRLPDWKIDHSSDGITSLTRLTSLEELSLSLIISGEVSWCFPTELRVLRLHIAGRTEATEWNLWESVSHLNKLEHLTTSGSFNVGTVSVLPSSSLQHLVGGPTREWCKLPLCIDVSCLPNLSHLDLMLEHLDEHDLKMLGMLPELRFLSLALCPFDKVISTVVVVSDKDTAEIYFPRLRCFVLNNAMVKSISFQEIYLTMPSVSCNRFMPCLQVLRFERIRLPSWDWDFARSDSLGLEYGFPSLREISIMYYRDTDGKILAAVRRSAEAHPNHPVFRAKRW